MFDYFRPKNNKNKNSMMIRDFDKGAYLEANPELDNPGSDTDLEDYLQVTGWKAIAEGRHRFHKNFDFFNEEKYLDLNSDIKENIDKGAFVSGYEHFRLFGYGEIIRRLRSYKSNVAYYKNHLVNIDDLEGEKLLPPINGFSLSNYLNMELDDGFESRLAHIYYNQIGYNNIVCGKSKFHSGYEIFDQEKYYRYCPDVEEAVKNGIFESAEMHFAQKGYKEIIEGKRRWPKDDKNCGLEKLRYINFRRIILKGAK